MRFLLALLFTFSTHASALEVMASGLGDTFETALTNAKIVAVGKVNGAWIHGDSYVRNNMFSEKITEYNGGVIASYEVMKWDGSLIIIKADVVPRDKNGMATNKADVPSNMRSELAGRKVNEDQRQKAIQVMDSRTRALRFETDKISYRNVGRMTEVTVVGEVAYQDKWIRDYTELLVMGGPMQLGTFYKPLRATVQGMDDEKVVTTNVVRFNDDLELYSATSAGLAINATKVVKVKLTFMAETDKLASVTKFDFRFN